MLHLEACLARVPSMADLGINDIVNGPIAHSPDGNPRIGPAFGLPNFWLSEAHSFGVTAAGGAGWQLAQWISEGEPSVEMLGVDPRRFGVTSKNYAKIKNEEASSHVFVNHYPMEERQAARAVKSLPVHSRLDQAGAVWGLALDGNGQIGSLCPERRAKATMLTAAPTGLRRSPVKWPRCASVSGLSRPHPSPSTKSKGAGRAPDWMGCSPTASLNERGRSVWPMHSILPAQSALSLPW